MLCIKCNIEKPKDNFYRNLNQCKPCRKKYLEEWRKKNIERIKISGIKYRKENRQNRSEYYKVWYSKNGRKRSHNYTNVINKWRIKNPEKIEAHKILKKAVLSGLIIRPNKCSKCYRVTKTFGHHPNYSKPLEVIWLCGSCHKIIHLTT